MTSLNHDHRDKRQTLRQICNVAVTIVIWMFKNYILWISFYLGLKAGDCVQEMRQEVQDERWLRTTPSIVNAPAFTFLLMQRFYRWHREECASKSEGK